MIQQRPIVDIMREVVASVSTALLAELQAINPKITAVHYQHGHPREIVETLAQLDKAPSKKYDKYPLIMLFQDFPEQMSDVAGSWYGTTTLQMVIAYDTKGDYKAAERYPVTFKPVLYPLYYELLDRIAKHPAFVVQSPRQIKHTKLDRVYWGRDGIYGSDKNIFNDKLDCIEIKDMQLTVNFNNCIKKINQFT